MTWHEVVKEVALKLDIPEEVVKEAYGSFWKFIRDSIMALPLKEDLTEEEFKQLKTNFNIPSIGKMACTYDRYKSIKDRFKYVKSLKDDNDNKECETDV